MLLVYRTHALHCLLHYPVMNMYKSIPLTCKDTTYWKPVLFIYMKVMFLKSEVNLMQLLYFLMHYVSKNSVTIIIIRKGGCLIYFYSQTLDKIWPLAFSLSTLHA